MENINKKLTLVFSAGCLGGLTNSLIVWFFGIAGITSAFGVKIAPVLSPSWLYPRLIWGGIWGLLFLLPILRKKSYLQGLLFSLGPTIVQLFIVFPFKAQKGLLGLELGMLTPLFVLIFNAVWGITVAVWLRLVESEK
jgi:hypothetical protein